MIHAGMKVASIAEKNIYSASAGYDIFFSAMIGTFMSCINQQRKHFMVYIYIFLKQIFELNIKVGKSKKIIVN